MRYILVNGRTPSGHPRCTRCSEHIATNYLREIRTRLFYCDHECYADHDTSVVLAIDSQARASSPTG